MAAAFQSNAFQSTAGHVAWQTGSSGPVVGPSVGTGAYYFTRKKWRALIDAMAAEAAARQRAEFMRPENRQARRAAALIRAADAAAQAIEQIRLEAEEQEREEHDAALVRLTELLNAATHGDTIKNADRLLEYANSFNDDEEEAISLLLLH